LTLDGILLALAIFGLRIINNAVGTLRVVFITRQMRVVAAVMAFVEAWVFAVVISSVVKDLSNVLNLMAYCGGFAVGNYVAMWLETRFLTTYMIVTVITRSQGHELAEILRTKGFGVTETRGEGRNGEVAMLRSVVTHRDIPALIASIRGIVPDAFIAVSEARTVQRGWVGSGRNAYND
jgi:uncharacterized protein YebE (UPF0316 family)